MERIRLGLVLDRNFHNEKRWVSAITPQLVEMLLSNFDCYWMQNQEEYIRNISNVDAILSMEPGWAAPKINFICTPEIESVFRKIPSYIIYSDPHENQWREDYFLANGINYILTYYRKPTLYHFKKVNPEQVLHFPWGIPDQWIRNDLVRYRGQRHLLCFGASEHEAYSLRNWARSFSFVKSEYNSGVENPVMSDEEYIEWLGKHDAIIAAGSDDPRYRLTVPKYFEIAASGALLFAQETEELEAVGFRHMKNCVVFNRDNFESLALGYLNHSYDFMEIREAGRELIANNHKMSDRIKFLVNHINNEIETRKRVNAADLRHEYTQTVKETMQYKNGQPADEFTYWFEKICDKQILIKAHQDPLYLDGQPLSWEVNHEIYAYEKFCMGELSADQLVGLSNARYSLLDQLWPRGNLTKNALDNYYISTAAILPWGHGVFAADHNKDDRRKNWLRRLELLRDLQKNGVRSLVDYGAGGGHTSLLARAMGFERVVHHEYRIFHPYIAYRSDSISVDANGQPCGRFELSNAEMPLNLHEPVDAILCLDVPEHVYDPDAMLDEIRSSLKPGGYLVWVAMFEENITCHLHPHLRGKEDELLMRHGFFRDHDLPVNYDGHTGVYRLRAAEDGKVQTIQDKTPLRNPESIVSTRVVQTKPTVLFIVDAPTWAHDQKTENLRRYLDDDYQIEKKFIEQVTAYDIENADLVVIYYWLQITTIPHLEQTLEKNKEKVIIGICSHYELEGNWKDQGIAVLNRMAGSVFVNSLLLYREFAPLLDVPVYYTPNGVDTSYYKPEPSMQRGNTLRVGWAGSLSNRPEAGEIDHKGYVDYIKPAMEMLDGIELVTAAREENWRGPEEMREFYRSLDLYICASFSEGTPNPCLEAAASGVPLLTTPVGNMPELVRHGVNGLFIERDLNDITEKLSMIYNNPSLLSSMSVNILADIKEWDWRDMSQNYKYMFQSALSANHAEADRIDAEIFNTTADVYLASADRIDFVQENLKQLAEKNTTEVDTYATVIGGMSGLNYLLQVRPCKIVFFDINVSAIPYAKLIVELIKISTTPEEFISRIFCRSVDEFTRHHGALTPDNQAIYLSQGLNEAILADTVSRLSRQAQNTYRTYLGPYLDGDTVPGVRNCCRLLPCWPDNERVPVGAGQELGTDESGNLVPNTNTFFYGKGWLSSASSYQKVKQSILNAELSFVPFDLLKQDIRLLTGTHEDVVVHASNIDDWFPEPWSNATEKWIVSFIQAQGKLTLVTGANGVGVLSPEPHLFAYMGIAPYVYGNVVEVTHKVPWGFYEIDRINVTTTDYLSGKYPADTTILHILMGEGRSADEFVRVCHQALRQSSRVIVIEHNSDSIDWSREQKGNYVTAEALLSRISEACEDADVSLTSFNTLRGEKDNCRNMFFVLDGVQADADMSHEIPGASVNNNDRPERDIDMENPLVSIIVPTYNRPYMLSMALQSIIDQDYQNWEAIVVNDAGKDVSSLVNSLDSLGRIRYIQHDINKGLSAARNTGLQNCSGDIICYLDDDDHYKKNHLTTVVEGLRDGDAEFVYTDAEYIVAQEADGNARKETRGNIFPHDDFSIERLYVGNYIPVNTWAHRSSLLKGAGLFDESLDAMEDWDFILRIANIATIRHIAVTTAEVHLRDSDIDNMSIRERKNYPQIYRNIYSRYKDMGNQEIRNARARTLQQIDGQARISNC